LVSAIALVCACNINPFHLGGNDGGIDGDAGGFDIDASGVVIDAGIPDAAIDAAPDACPVADEICDGADNDCDTAIDEDFNFESDPANCGGCGMACSKPNMAGTCNAMVCEFECLPGYIDLDGDLDNGCELLCTPTNGGVEACDFTDNDCDDIIDEDFDLDEDEANCGGCGAPCLVLHATPLCTGGVCGYTECDDGFSDVLPGVPGCEYECPDGPAGTPEQCDAVDQDCDGVVDELPIVGLGDPCTDPGFESFGDTGECAFGERGCSFGTPFCIGYVRPTGELCDQLDNDCDGDTDETFDTDTDPRNCGATCEVCAFPNAVANCTGGVCGIAACNAGFVDADGVLSNGCEYGCTPTGPEVCDGVDNDCDTLVDTDDPGIITVPNFCVTNGACAGTAPECTSTACDSTVKWRCVYGGASEADACGDLPLQEALCDAIDGDCDTRTDETFLLKGSACDDGLLGECRGTGTLVCNTAGDDLECDITSPGATPEAAELFCDNLDEDCDGILDEAAPDTMVNVIDGALDFYIDAYEASRPDATSSNPGVAEHRPCSNAGAQPWRSVSWLDADAACAAAGKRLCTDEEWQAACEGVANNTFPYGNVYDADACNGNDYDHDCTPPDEDICLPAGTSYGCPTPPATSACLSEAGAFDMSGNVKEWTGEQVSAVPAAYRIRGGAHDSISVGLTCQFDFVAGGEAFFFPNLGFRCCSDTAP
jgi:hypothetical protein